MKNSERRRSFIKKGFDFLMGKNKENVWNMGLVSIENKTN